jgi:hypothetical protein
MGGAGGTLGSIVGVGLGVDVGLGVGVDVGGRVAVAVEVGVRVGVCVGTCVGVGVTVAVDVSVGVAVGVDVAVGVEVGMPPNGVGVGVTVHVGVNVGRKVGVGVTRAIPVGSDGALKIYTYSNQPVTPKTRTFKQARMVRMTVHCPLDRYSKLSKNDSSRLNRSSTYPCPRLAIWRSKPRRDNPTVIASPGETLFTSSASPASTAAIRPSLALMYRNAAAKPTNRPATPPASNTFCSNFIRFDLPVMQCHQVET